MEDIIRRKKLIEVALPLEAINEEGSQRKRKAPAGYPTTLHKWWAQRPVAAARAVIFAQMVDDPSAHPEQFPTEELQEQERQRLFEIMRDLVKWDNTNDRRVLGAAQAEIWNSWRRACDDNTEHPQARELFDPTRLPVFFDPFAGSGALPLEAQRLGLEAYGSDLNPVAVLITKAMIEIPPRFIGSAPVHPESRDDSSLLHHRWSGSQGLAEDVLYYGEKVRQEAATRIGHLYPNIRITAEMASERPDLVSLVGKDLTITAWLWSRTVKSPNPAFATIDVPLASTFMLSTKTGKEVYVEPIVTREGYHFVVRTGKPKDREAANRGTKAGGSHSPFVCLMSGTPMPFDYLRTEAKAGRFGSKLMAIVAAGRHGRVYLSPTPEMEALAANAKPDWKPDVEISHWPGRTNVVEYGLTAFSDLFTGRQLVGLTTLSDVIGEIRDTIVTDAIAAGLNDDEKSFNDGGRGAHAYAEAVAVYLSFAVSRTADYGSTIATWRPKDNAMRASIAKAIPMTWDFAEASIFGDSSGAFISCVRVVARAISTSLNCAVPGVAVQSDAATHTRAVPRMAVISTDPPYYSNIGYSELSDFLYVWLRRSLRDIFPGLFSLISVPKTEELVASPYRHGSEARAKSFFLKGMTNAMQRLVDIAHPAFPMTIYYAFMQSESEIDGSTTSTAWETFLAAVVRAGLSISGTWPMRTEGDNRQIGIGANALASSIVLVCRPRSPEARTITRRELIITLKDEIPSAIAHLQHGNLAPVDLAQAAIGPGMAVFTRYARVLDAEGSELTVRDALALINEVLDEVLAEQEGEFDAETRFAIAWFEQFGFAEGDFGVADILARAKNTSVPGLVKAGMVLSRSKRVRLLRPDELNSRWEPTDVAHRTAWGIVHHLVRALEFGGESAAAALVADLRSNAEVGRDLAYRLYSIAERKKRAPEALSYNSLVQSWPEIVHLSRDGRYPAPVQTDLLGAF